MRASGKFWLTVLLLLAVVIASGLFILPLQVDLSVRRRSSREAFVRADEIGRSLLQAAQGPGIYSLEDLIDDSDWLERFLSEGLSSTRFFRFVALANPAGEMLAYAYKTPASTSEHPRIKVRVPRNVQRVLDPPRAAELTGTEELAVYEKPVLNQGRLFGIVKIGVAEGWLLEEINQSRSSTLRVYATLSGVVILALCVAAAAIRHSMHRQRMAVDAIKREKQEYIQILTRGMVHEVRNPLNAMRMQLGVICNRVKQLDDPRLDAAERQLERLGKEILRLQNLATDYRTLGRPEGDVLQDVDVDQVVRDVVDLLRAEFETAGIDLVVSSELPTGGSIVRMDPDRLHQVLQNLLGNARDAVKENGRVSVRLACEGHDRLALSICDNGVGIPPEKLPHVFEPFFSDKPGGTGLGLAIVKPSVEAVGGTVSVNSHPGVETIFKLTCPVVKLKS